MFYQLYFLAFSIKNNLKIIKKFFISLILFVFWIFLALSPWLAKNISETYPQISISTLISWKAENFNPDFSKIHSKKELETIEKKQISLTISNSWTTSNEDFWRYFWYEKWINNYIKLPWNLTMQTNQRWEYTDIWFLFLALLPIILVFLPFRNKYFYFLLFILLFSFYFSIF